MSEFTCRLYPVQSCSNCGFCCDNSYSEGECPNWEPCRGSTPSSPLPCEVSNVTAEEFVRFYGCGFDRACSGCPHSGVVEA